MFHMDLDPPSVFTRNLFLGCFPAAEAGVRFDISLVGRFAAAQQPGAVLLMPGIH
jgi:hypothetical protein